MFKPQSRIVEAGGCVDTQPCPAFLGCSSPPGPPASSLQPKAPSGHSRPGWGTSFPPVKPKVLCVLEWAPAHLPRFVLGEGAQQASGGCGQQGTVSWGRVFQASPSCLVPNHPPLAHLSPDCVLSAAKCSAGWGLLAALW